MSKVKKYQFNERFERLFDDCMDEVKPALKKAQTPKERDEILKNYGFDVNEFCAYVYRKTDDTMIMCGVDAHLQRSADFVGKSPKTIYNHT